MNSIENPIKVRFSKASDGDALVAFYQNDARRTPGVFMRHPPLLKKQAREGLFVTAWQDGELVAASTVYALANGKKIDCVDHGQNRIEQGRVVELGSVLAFGQDPADTAIPKGFWRLILFGIPVIAALKSNVQFDLLIAEVVRGGKTADRTRDYVQGTEESGSPLRFDPITGVALEMLEACGATTDDPNKERGKDFFRAYVHKNVVPVAEALSDILNKGYVGDMRPKDTIGYDPNMRAYVDLSGLNIASTLDVILSNQDYFRNFDRYGSWGEAARGLAARTPRTHVNQNSPAAPPPATARGNKSRRPSKPSSQTRSNGFDGSGMHKPALVG